MKSLLSNVTAIWLLLGVFLVVAGCTAHLPPTGTPARISVPDAYTDTKADPEQEGMALRDVRHGTDEAEDVSFLTDLEDPLGLGAVPGDSNGRVEHFVRLFTGPQKAWVQRALERSGRYRDRIWEIFREEGIPEELVYLALIESGYNPHAYSRSGAVGIWQFMPATGRRYGLVIDWWVDERRDLEKSTRAAARYLKDLYALFEDWHLAAAAYNAGEGRLLRGLERYRTGCYWDLSEKTYLAQETREYVPRFLAVLTIARDPERHGFHDLKYEEPLSYETVAIQQPMDLAVVARACGADPELLKKLNPQLRRGFTPSQYHGPYEIQIPRGSRERFTAFSAGLRPEERLTFIRHTARRGETLSHISRRYGVPVDAIVSMNGMRSQHLIREGQDIVVPLPVRFAAPRGPGEPRPATVPARSGDIEYRVRQGDTLWGIALRHGVSVNTLRGWNRLSDSAVIHPGQRLAIRQATGNVPQAATAAQAGTSPALLGVPQNAAKVVYRVRQGDTLWGIANRHGVTPASLARWNSLATSENIHPGQALEIWQPDRTTGSTATSDTGTEYRPPPDPTVHTVRAGDTLWDIARRYGVSLSDLARWNGIDVGQTIRPGMRIYLGPRSDQPAREDLLASQCASVTVEP